MEPAGSCATRPWLSRWALSFADDADGGRGEGVGLVKWGRWQSTLGQVKHFKVSEAVMYEALQMVLMAIVILVCAHLIKALGNTFHVRNTYASAFTVVIYGLSPVFLFRLLDVFPNLILWVPWGIGIMLTIKTLYHGVPRIMLPDPPDAFGLYFMSALLLAMVTAAGTIHHRRLLERKFQSGGKSGLRPRRPAAVLKMKATVEQQLLDALAELDNAVKAMANASPKPNLLPLFARIDELAEQLPQDTDPALLHYLNKKSYEKARLFLQGRDTENQIGNCRHV